MLKSLPFGEINMIYRFQPTKPVAGITSTPQANLPNPPQRLCPRPPHPAVSHVFLSWRNLF